jgi:hypothetical protein
MSSPRFHLVLVALLLVASCSDAPAPEPKRSEPTGKELRRFQINLDFGVDRGQSFGSVFELTDRDGRVIGGAGFTDVYNSYFRTDRYKLQFYIKPVVNPDSFAIERIAHSEKNAGAYLFDLDDTLYAWMGDGRPIKELRMNSSHLKNSNQFGSNVVTLGAGVMNVAGKRLSFFNGGVQYDGKAVVKSPKQGRYSKFYYAEGHLFFYHRDVESTKICAVKWEPGYNIPVDVSAGSVVKTAYRKTSCFSWGQHRGRVVTVGNYGGIYTFVDDGWVTELAGSDQASYQIYSMMNFDGRSYMAQYPTGNLFQYEKGEPKHLIGWPPVMEGVSRDAREAQTLGIYRGDLMVGVWPWAELWRLEKGSPTWKFMGRGFTHPRVPLRKAYMVFEPWLQNNRGFYLAGFMLVVAMVMGGMGRRRNKMSLRWASLLPVVIAISVVVLTSMCNAERRRILPVHPYESDAERYGFVLNHWGQRITGMVPMGEYLYVSTSSKGVDEWKSECDFLNEAQRQEYGAILKMHMEGVLSVPVKWATETTTLEIRIHDDHFVMLQDGRELGRAAISPTTARQVVGARAKLGSGVFGRSGVATLEWNSP